MNKQQDPMDCNKLILSVVFIKSLIEQKSSRHSFIIYIQRKKIIILIEISATWIGFLKQKNDLQSFLN